MAGDWIKVERAALTKPEILEMAANLGIDRHAVLGKLLEVWFWFDEQTKNGNAVGVTDVTLKRYINERTCVTGFGEEMERVGWLMGCSIPNFERHNGKSAKNRAVTKERVKRFRNAESVTNVTQSPLPEKRREEKKTNPLPSLRSGLVGKSGNGENPEPPEVQEKLSTEDTRAVWAAYALAFDKRYGTAPVRNAKTNGQIAQLVKRLGSDAAHVAAFYLGHGDPRYTREGHSVGMLLAHAEKLAAEWKTGGARTDGAWKSSRDGIERKATELGIERRGDESDSSLRDRCLARLEKQRIGA